MKNEYLLIQKKLLLTLSQRKLTKTFMAKKFWRFSPEEKEKLLNRLIDDDLIKTEVCPTLNATKPTTYYILTSKGKSWVTKHLKSLKS